MNENRIAMGTETAELADDIRQIENLGVHARSFCTLRVDEWTQRKSDKTEIVI
jgi:hypothetical protein